MTLLLRSPPCLRVVATALLLLVALLAAQAVAFCPCPRPRPVAAYNDYDCSASCAITPAVMCTGKSSSAAPPLRKWGKPGGGASSPSAQQPPLRKWGKQSVSPSSDGGGGGGVSPASSAAPAPAKSWDHSQSEKKRTTTRDVYKDDDSTTSSSSGIPVLPEEAKKNVHPATTRTATTGTPECQHIQTLIDTHKLLMFMNGSQANSKCEHSDTAAKVLERLCGAGSVKKNGKVRGENLFVTVDATSDDGAIRKGLQEYNPEWDAAIPQLYVNGEFKGGADSMLKMFNTGVFQRLINEIESE